MNIKDDSTIRKFLSQKTFALAGASRSGEGFGCKVMHHMIERGYEILVVHPLASEIEGVHCYPSLAAVPKAVDGLILIVPPDQSEDLVREADIIGIRRVWMQPGAESEDAIAYCEERCIEVIHSACLLVLA